MHCFELMLLLGVVVFVHGGDCLENFRKNGWCDYNQCLDINQGSGVRTCLEQIGCDASICPVVDGTMSDCFVSGWEIDQYEHVCANGDGCPLAKFDRNIETCTYATSQLKSTCDSYSASPQDCDDNTISGGCDYSKIGGTTACRPADTVVDSCAALLTSTSCNKNQSCKFSGSLCREKIFSDLYGSADCVNAGYKYNETSYECHQFLCSEQILSGDCESKLEYGRSLCVWSESDGCQNKGNYGMFDDGNAACGTDKIFNQVGETATCTLKSGITACSQLDPLNCIMLAWGYLGLNSLAAGDCVQDGSVCRPNGCGDHYSKEQCDDDSVNCVWANVNYWEHCVPRSSIRVCSHYISSGDCQSNSGCYWDISGQCSEKTSASRCISLSVGDCSLVQVDGVAACFADPEIGCRRKKCSDYNSESNCPSSSTFPYCEWRLGLSPEGADIGVCVPYGFPLGNCAAYNFSGACDADTTIGQYGCAWMGSPWSPTSTPYCGAIQTGSSCEYFLTQEKCSTVFSGQCFWNRGQCQNKTAIVSCDELDSNNCGSGLDHISCVPEAGECRRKTCADSYADVESSTRTCKNDASCTWVYSYSGELPVEGVSTGVCVSTENMGGCAAYRHPQQCMETTGCLYVTKPGLGGVCVTDSSVTECAWMTNSSICNNNERHSDISCVWQTSACVASSCGSITTAVLCGDNSACLWVKNKEGDGGACVPSLSLVSCGQYQNNGQCISDVNLGEEAVKGCTWTAEYKYDLDEFEEKCVPVSKINTLECQVLTNETQCKNQESCKWTTESGFDAVTDWLNTQFSGHCVIDCISHSDQEGCWSGPGCLSVNDNDGKFVKCVNYDQVQSLDCDAADYQTECYVISDCYWDYSSEECKPVPTQCTDRDQSYCNNDGKCHYSHKSATCKERSQNCGDCDDRYECEGYPKTGTGEPKCFWEYGVSESDSTCEEITKNDCGDYDSQSPCQSILRTAAGDPKCFWEYATDSEGNDISTCKKVTDNCGDYHSQWPCQSNPKTAAGESKCFWETETGTCEQITDNCGDYGSQSPCQSYPKTAKGESKCFWKTGAGTCKEITNNCGDYDSQSPCESNPRTAEGESKCFWEYVYDSSGNVIGGTCKEITNNCEDYESYGTCQYTPHAVKCYFKSSGESSSCEPVSPPCTATEIDDCYSSGLCEVAYLDSEYKVFKCVRRPCSSYASSLEECQVFDDCESYISYPHCSEIPDPAPIESCDGGLSEEACVAKTACVWKGAEAGCSYSCESRRSEWSCKSNGCAYLEPAYTGNGKCVVKNSVVCSDFVNRAQCEGSKDARGTQCVFAKSLADGASETDFECKQLSQTCAGAKTSGECSLVVDPSSPIGPPSWSSCTWDNTDSKCRYPKCSDFTYYCPELCYLDYSTYDCMTYERPGCDLDDSTLCSKIIRDDGKKCHFSYDNNKCELLDLSVLTDCDDGDFQSCAYITPAAGGRCYWGDSWSCETLPADCNDRSVSACTLYDDKGCYVTAAEVPECAEIPSTCGGYTSKTDCETYIKSTTNPSYPLCFWSTDNKCVQGTSPFCTATAKDDCESSGQCMFDDSAGKCKRFPCGTYSNSKDLCSLIYGCEYVDTTSTCRSSGAEVTKCSDLDSTDCLPVSLLAGLDCVVDETKCRPKVCGDSATQASCNAFIPAGGTGKCVWTKGAAESDPGHCVPLSSVSSCESFVDSSTCILREACFWNILSAETKCLNKSAITSCSAVNKAHCSAITNIACFPPKTTGDACVDGVCGDIEGTTSDKEDTCTDIPACSWVYSSSGNTNSGTCVFRDDITCVDYKYPDQCDSSVDPQGKQCVHAQPYTSGGGAPAVCKVLSQTCAQAQSGKECGLVDDKTTSIDGCQWDTTSNTCRHKVCGDISSEECPSVCFPAGPTCASYERSSCDLDNPADCAKIILPGGGICQYSGGACKPLESCSLGDSTTCNKILVSDGSRCYWDGDSCEVLPTQCESRPQIACDREHLIGCYFSSASQCVKKSSSCSDYLSDADCQVLLRSDISETAKKCFWDTAPTTPGCVEAASSCASAVSEPDCSSSGLCLFSGGKCERKACLTYSDTATCTFAGCEYSSESSSCKEKSDGSKPCSELGADSCKGRGECAWDEGSGTCSPSKGSDPQKSNTGLILGIVIPCVVVLALLVVGLTFLVLFLKKRGPFKKEEEEPEPAREGNQVEMTPASSTTANKK